MKKVRILKMKNSYPQWNKINHLISSDSHPPATANKAIHCFKLGGLQNQREHPEILIKYVAVGAHSGTQTHHVSLTRLEL